MDLRRCHARRQEHDCTSRGVVNHRAWRPHRAAVSDEAVSAWPTSRTART